ncbi:MAG: serine/threonine-protein kinase [Polyangiales bacterium]
MAETLRPGEVLGRDFKVIRRLAAGGMGTVYEAVQLSTGKRRALKVMHAQYEGDERTRQRFVQEARATAAVDSDHIVEMVAAGVDETRNAPWIVMELLQGEDLKTALHARGRFDWPDCLEIFAQLGHALAAAHAMGLVHRDLKPENIFLATPRRAGVPFTVKVLDFGLAKLVQESSTNGNGTQAVGSPRWMAPEQTQADGQITAVPPTCGPSGSSPSPSSPGRSTGRPPTPRRPRSCSRCVSC